MEHSFPCRINGEKELEYYEEYLNRNGDAADTSEEKTMKMTVSPPSGYIDKALPPPPCKDDRLCCYLKTAVGKLVKMGLEGGRSTRPELKVGICGEHGGDPASIEFCNEIGMNYVSCSPFRVPIARLAAAQAAIKAENEPKTITGKIAKRLGLK